MNHYSSLHSRPAALPERVIGLTGGVGMGKTTVSDYLAHTYQIPVLDADIYARDAVQPGSQVLQDIIDRYGSGIILSNGDLNRRRLGEIVFHCPPERLWLEQLIHPYVRDRIQTDLQDLAAQNCQTVVLAVPLLFEARMTDLVTETWVVYCSPEQQVTRLLERDRLDLQQVQARINSQMPIQKKLERADIVLDNSAAPEILWQQIDQALLTSKDV